MKVRRKNPIVDAVQWWPPGDPRHLATMEVIFVEEFSDRGGVWFKKGWYIWQPERGVSQNDRLADGDYIIDGELVRQADFDREWEVVEP